MADSERHKHWENIYRTRQVSELSWYQQVPTTSLDFVKQFNLSGTAKIIDIGGGYSYFADYLLDLGYQDITVLDISETAIRKARERLGDKAEKIKWIVTDIVDFKPTEKYDFWHDRAAFHFLTREHDIEKYIDIAQRSIRPSGILVIGSFSENGPKKCSGIDVKQYSEDSMEERLTRFFKKINCITVDHQTPFGRVQNFIFCSFKKLKTYTDNSQQ
jgi:SAM-dependent methyltransferase